MRYRGENLVENSVNEGCRGWDLDDIAGDSVRPVGRAGAPCTSAPSPALNPIERRELAPYYVRTHAICVKKERVVARPFKKKHGAFFSHGKFGRTAGQGY
jgi:hypothetical protein